MPSPNRTKRDHGVCSQTAKTFAPRSRKYVATAGKRGPVPATTTRLPSTGSPDFTSACKPPAPITFGSVQPGKGTKNSRAPVAKISSLYSIERTASPDSAVKNPCSTWNTRAPWKTFTEDFSSRSNHRSASDFCDAPGPPLHICPPGRGLSSKSATFAPESAALTAAAIPAGPAPTTATSNRRFAELLTGRDFHFRLANDLATAQVGLPIDRNTAFKASTHAAQRRPRLARNGSAASIARKKDGDCNRCPRGHGHRLTVHAYLYAFTHVAVASFAAREDRVPQESPASAKKCGSREFSLSQATW